MFDNIELRAVTDEELRAFDRFFNGLDFGFANDPDALTRWAYSRRAATLYAVGEYYGTHTMIDTLAEKVKALAGGETVYADSEAPRAIAELRQRGVNALSVRKGAGSVKAGIRWLQNLKSIVIDPKRAPNAAREFRAYEYARDHNGNFLPDVPDRDNHCIDSCRYGMSTVILGRTATTRKDLGL